MSEWPTADRRQGVTRLLNLQDELFNQYDKVLERAQQVHVMEIMHEPKVRAYIRKRLDEHFITTTGLSV